MPAAASAPTLPGRRRSGRLRAPTATQGEWRGGNDRLNILLVGSDAGRAQRERVPDRHDDGPEHRSADADGWRSSACRVTPRDIPLPSNGRRTGPTAARGYPAARSTRCRRPRLHSPSLFPEGNKPDARLRRAEGSARHPVRDQDQLLRGGRPDGLPRRGQHPWRRDDRRADPGLRPQVPGQRGQGLDQAVHPARHPVHGWLRGTRLRPSAAHHERLRPRRAPAARAHLGPRADGSARRCSRLASSTSSSRAQVRTSGPTSRPSCSPSWSDWRSRSTSTTASRWC